MPRLCTPIALRKRAEFLAVSAAKERWVTPAFILQKGPRKDEGTCGFGLTASKKMIGCAVVRNRARRRLRALAKDVLPSLPVGGLNLVFIAKRDVLTREYEALRNDLLWALKRLGVRAP